MQSPNRYRILMLAAALSAALFMAPSAFADQIVYFVNGKAITVKNVEKGDRLTILEIEGGGRIGVPTVQIDRIEVLQLSPPQPAAAAPVATSPQPVVANPQPASAASTVPPAGAIAPKPGTTGPGFGGRVTLPGNNLAGGQPIEIGAADANGEGDAKPVTAPARAAAAAPYVPPANMMPPPGPPNGRPWDGAIGRPGVNNRRTGNRNGAFRGRPLAMYQPPQTAPAQQPAAGQKGTAGQPGTTNPPAPPAPPVTAPDEPVPAETPASTDGEPTEDGEPPVDEAPPAADDPIDDESGEDS